MKTRMIWFLGLLLAALGSTQAQTLDELAPLCDRDLRSFAAHRSGKLENPNSSRYDVVYHRLEWKVNPAEYYIRGSVTLYFRALQQLDVLGLDCSDALQINKILYHGTELSVIQPLDLELNVPLPLPVPAGTLDSIRIEYEGSPESQGFGSFEQADHNGVPALWTLSQPYGARDWWPCKQGLQDKVDSVDIYITVPFVYSAASNGKLQWVKQLTPNLSEQTWYWKHRHPIATYLIALAVTNYEKYSDFVNLSDGQSLEVLNYVYPENLDNAKKGTAALLPVIQFFDKKFGLYPFRDEKYGHAQFGWGGGMEHQTMSFVGGFSFGLLAHELAHMWFGDLVTCGSWADIWLNEGAATYLTALSYEGLGQSNYWRSWKKQTIPYVTSEPGGSVYVPDTSSVGRIFSGRLSYYKGAMVFHMLRYQLGDSLFFPGIRNYLNDPEIRDAFALTADLREHLEAISQLDLKPFFEDYVYGEGYPSYQVIWFPKPDGIHLLLSQTTSHPSVDFFDIPVPIRVYLHTGDSLDFQLDAQVQDQEFDLTLDGTVDSIRIDPDLWLISANNQVQQVTGSTEQNPEGSQFLYPNPADRKIWISHAEDVDPESSWTICNLYGQVCQAGTGRDLLPGVDIRGLPSGIYWLRHISKGKGRISRWIKQP